ncbi:MAG: ABC transporter substrate-binding protein [Ruminococcaceae bacterium]|nr:ABC transporter substrate-binding protein [Oscillospiraceae bacterium]
MVKNRALICILIVAIAVTSAVAFASCGKQDDISDSEAVGFTDALGRKITVQKNPERVASLIGSFSDVWLLSGGELCASAEDAWDDFGLDLGDAVNLGGAHSPSLELLISADPDFVIASASTAADVEMKDLLESMGITVAYFDVDSFEDYLAMLDICTDITGRKDLYLQNGLALKTKIDEIKDAYKNADVPTSERKILLLRAASSFVRAKGSSGTILGEMLADMGCINIADSNTGILENLSVEAIIAEEPHAIFVVTMGSDTEAARQSLENMMKENPAWGTLEAVKSGRLYIMDKALFNLKPNARWAESYEILYEKLTEK